MQQSCLELVRRGMRALAAVMVIMGGATVLFSFAEGRAADQTVAQDYPYLEKLYRHLHSHPELSYQEAETAKRIAAEWRALGFRVTEGVGGHGVVAILDNGPGPTVMLRTDLDALPVAERTGLPYASSVKATEQTGQEVSVMHACGHDVHMTVLVGTARWLAAHRDRWSGRLMLIGQPAEERGAGARMMLDDGLFTRFPKPDFALALHVNAALPAGTVAYVPGYALANVDSVDITVHGIGGHGAYPQATKDPIVLAAEIVLALQTIASREIDPRDPVVVTVGSIHGGAKHNIIPERVDLQLTVRSYSDATRRKVLDAIKRITVNMGRVAGLPEDLLPEVKIHEEEYTPATYNDPALTEQLAQALKARFGADRVIKAQPVMGGEDFARYGRAGAKAVMLWLGAVDPEKWKRAQEGKLSLPSLHSPYFAPLPKPTITTGVETMVTAVLTLMGRKGNGGS